MKNKFFKIALILNVFAFMLSCSEDDNTGDSTFQVTNPTLTVSLDFANSQTLIEEDITYGFTVSISEPQVVNVAVNLSQTGGNASRGDDFDFPSQVVIPAGATSASDVITIISDNLVEDIEDVTITIATGAEANVQAINSETVTFNLINLVEGDLLTGLSWDITGFEFPDGSPFDPTVLADLRLLITDVPYTTILGGANGGSFEAYTLTSASPDGDYYVVADWFSAFDLGDQGFFDVDLTATFDQVGVINGLSYTFPAALNSGNSCSDIYFVLAQITKTGDSYEIVSVGENSPVTAAPFIGTATVVVDDWADYAIGDSIEIEAGANENEFWIRTYSNTAISNPTTAYMIVTIDSTTGDVTVISNEDFQYGCSEGDVTGSGSVNACARTIDLVLDFGLGNCGDFSGYVFTLQL